MIACGMLLLGLASASPACTVFSDAEDGVLLFGHSGDSRLSETYVWPPPRRGDLHGSPWLGFCRATDPGEMNDAGLCFDATASASFVLNVKPRKTCASPNRPERPMERCATVADVERFFQAYNFSPRGIAQLLFLDPTERFTFYRITGRIV